MLKFHLTFKYYDPGIGRFITADPIRFQGGINFYTYCLNNPISQIDIYGLLSTCPKGYHREYDNAGFVDCFLLNPETVVVCGVCVGIAVSGVGSGFGVIACSACLVRELYCMSQHSRCVCD